MKTIAEQEKNAERLYKEAFAKHPRATRTTVLWCKWRDLKARLISLQAKEKAA